MSEPSHQSQASAWRSPLLPHPVDPVAQNELVQVRLRVLVASVLLLIMGALQWWGAWGAWDRSLMALGLYLLVSLIWGVVVRQNWMPQRGRLFASVVIEQASYAAFLVYGEDQGIWLLGVPIFSALGHGLRFGPAKAVFSACAGAALLALAMLSSAYWRAMPGLSVGLVLATLGVPVYAAMLSRRLHAERAQAERRAAVWEEASKTDALTGLSNRLGLNAALDDVLASQRHLVRVSALFYIDLDGFKAINDEAGHAAGDAVLQQVAQALRNVVRGDDVVARMGGDEFAILGRGLVGTNDARLVAVKAMAAINQIRVPGHDALKVACSVGVCLLPDAALSTSMLALSAADELMLQVKRAGKGHVRVRGEPAQARRA